MSLSGHTFLDQSGENFETELDILESDAATLRNYVIYLESCDVLQHDKISFVRAVLRLKLCEKLYLTSTYKLH